MNAQHGGPAFPTERNLTQGMTLRDYFAAKAMQGLMVGVEKPSLGYIAVEAYKMADAMLRARK